MSKAQTLFQLAGADLAPAPLSGSTLLIIDAQNEYLKGPVALPGIDAAISQIADLLARARKAGTPVVHVQHLGKPGALFDPESARSHIVDALAPLDDETVVTKGLPNAFAGTDLADVLADKGRDGLIVTGFMTHMCVSATARAALDHGKLATVVAGACGTRPLPDPVTGEDVPADTVHRTALAELSDRFAVIAREADDIPY